MASMQTAVLLDSINQTEFLALTEGKKDIVKIIISAGVVNMTPGCPTYNLFHSIFPSGSITWETLESDLYKNRQTISSGV